MDASLTHLVDLIDKEVKVIKSKIIKVIYIQIESSFL